MLLRPSKGVIKVSPSYRQSKGDTSTPNSTSPQRNNDSLEGTTKKTYDSRRGSGMGS